MLQKYQFKTCRYFKHCTPTVKDYYLDLKIKILYIILSALNNGHIAVQKWIGNK